MKQQIKLGTPKFQSDEFWKIKDCHKYWSNDFIKLVVESHTLLLFKLSMPTTGEQLGSTLTATR
jgi:hypothetical protein